MENDSFSQFAPVATVALDSNRRLYLARDAQGVIWARVGTRTGSVETFGAAVATTAAATILPVGYVVNLVENAGGEGVSNPALPADKDQIEEVYGPDPRTGRQVKLRTIKRTADIVETIDHAKLFDCALGHRSIHYTRPSNCPECGNWMMVAREIP